MQNMKLHKITRYISGLRDIFCSHTRLHLREEVLMKRYYQQSAPLGTVHQTEIVMMIDGRCLHGGLSDRIRGIAGVYGFCRRHRIPFYIHHVYPFRLEDYLAPNQVDWLLPDDRLTYHPAESHPIMLQAALLPAKLHSLALSQYVKRYAGKQLHIYSNTVMNDADFHQHFQELFRPAPRLAKALEQGSVVPHSGYVAMVFRFQQLLGDFKEGGFAILSNQERQQLMDRCVAKVDEIHQQAHPQSRVLITSDSTTFLHYIQARKPYVVTIPGKVVHMDFSVHDNYETYQKSFVDLLLLSGADKIYLLRTGKMYRSGFGKRAAKLGDIPYEEVKF